MRSSLYIHQWQCYILLCKSPTSVTLKIAFFYHHLLDFYHLYVFLLYQFSNFYQHFVFLYYLFNFYQHFALLFHLFNFYQHFTLLYHLFYFYQHFVYLYHLFNFYLHFVLYFFQPGVCLKNYFPLMKNKYFNL